VFAPDNLTNRFELLLTNNPTSLPLVLNEFAARNVLPAAVKATSHDGNKLVVTVTVKRMQESAALALQVQLKTLAMVLSARLEHLVT
jgi:hypothetical protein